MTLSTSGYTVGNNEPLNHARILWNVLSGTVAGTGTGFALAANDYTNQRWALATGANDWTLTAPAAGDLDTVFISAHNLAGVAFRPQYAASDVTNLLTYSEQVDNAAWDKTGGAVTANQGTAPDSALTADSFIEDAGNSEHFANRSLTVADGQNYTFSTHVKQFSGSRTFRLRTALNAGNNTVDLNLATGVLTVTGSGSLVSSGVIALPDGWFRVWMTVTAAGAGTGIFRHQLINSVPVYTGDGTSGILIWGSQLQTGNLSSYIQTVASTVTSPWRDLLPLVWITPADNSTIAIMANQASGDAYITTGVRLAFSNAPAGTVVGIIRAGEALQMQRAFYGGYLPIRLNRVTEGQQSFSETGQWLGRIEKRVALNTTYNWSHLTADWYRANFDPFARTLPLNPFGIIGNPARMPEDVAWAWTSQDARPQNMGIRDLMQVSLDVTGYFE